MSHKQAVKLVLCNDTTIKSIVDVVEALLNEEPPTLIAKRLGIARSRVYQVKSKYIINKH